MFQSDSTSSVLGRDESFCAWLRNSWVVRTGGEASRGWIAAFSSLPLSCNSQGGRARCVQAGPEELVTSTLTLEMGRTGAAREAAIPRDV